MTVDRIGVCKRGGRMRKRKYSKSTVNHCSNEHSTPRVHEEMMSVDLLIYIQRKKSTLGTNLKREKVRTTSVNSFLLRDILCLFTLLIYSKHLLLLFSALCLYPLMFIH